MSKIPQLNTECHWQNTRLNCVRSSDIKRDDGIKLSLMNFYQIHKAVLFWAPRWEAACRRIFLHIQNDKTFQILFCIWQRFQCQLHCFTAIAFPNLPFLHKLTRFKLASVLLFKMLPPVAGEYSLGGKTILIVSDIYIKTQLVYPYRPAMVVMSSLGEYCGAFIWVAMLSMKIFILANPLSFDWEVLL